MGVVDVAASATHSLSIALIHQFLHTINLLVDIQLGLVESWVGCGLDAAANVINVIENLFLGEFYFPTIHGHPPHQTFTGI